MRWEELPDEPCSIARSLAVIGDRWTMLVLRECFLRARRFEEFEDRLGISRTMLAARLALLVEHGVLERRPYSDRPLRHQYRLTGKGLDLYPVIIAIVGWGDKYYSGGGSPPVLLRHKQCQHDFHMVPTCSCCGEPLTARDVEARAIAERTVRRRP
jgi:DNA-binding HxlR family transcriptional regulator